MTLSLCLLAGCGQSVETTARLTVKVGDASQAEVAKTMEVLLARFNSSKPAASSVSATAEAGAIRFDFRGESRSPAEIIYLGVVQGAYALGPSDAPDQPWIRDLDFVSAECVRKDDKVYLDTQVSHEKGLWLREVSRANIGKVLETYWDGKVVSQTTLHGVMEDHFKSPLPQDNHTDLMCIILKSGRTPVAIPDYDFKLATTELPTG